VNSDEAVSDEDDEGVLVTLSKEEASVELPSSLPSKFFKVSIRT
jgi:hypothetical protein